MAKKQIDFKKIIIKKNFTLIVTYFFFSIILSFFFIGYENINVVNTKWLFVNNDLSAHQTGWHFFKNDIWRFPIGMNPNFGDNIGNSIIYSDSIPILAFIFKLLNPLLPDQFQYFSLWFILCFFFQGILSFSIIHYYTKDRIFSILGSLIFIFLPILIYRISWHPALFGQWILIISYYLLIEDKENNEKFWILLILLSSLIHFYFTIINLIIYNISKIYSFLILKNMNFKSYLRNLIIIHLSLIILMYISGYFEVRIVDAVAVGFGQFKLNLLSIIDSTNSIENIHWSRVLPDIKLKAGEELEGFNFVGLGILLLILFILFYALKDKKLKKNLIFFFNKKTIIIITVLTLISLSNIISLGSIELINLPLNKYIYGFLSIVRSSGRIFWFVNYFIILSCLILLHYKFKSKKALWVLLIILCIQFIDTSKGLENYLKLKQINNYNHLVKDPFWTTETKNLSKIYTTSPVNYNNKFDNLAYLINTNNFKKTNIIKSARVDRSKISNLKYQLNEDFTKKKLDSKTLYIIDNIGHLINLKNIFNNENVGFFLRDNIWSMIPGKKDKMTIEDTRLLNNIEPETLTFSKTEKINFNQSSFLGLGWTHNFNKNGAWSEGKYSYLQFQSNENSDDLYLELELIPFLTEKNSNLNLEIFINDKLNKIINFEFDEKDKTKKVKLKISKNIIENNLINIKFINKNLLSPYDVNFHPDSRKLAFLLTKITLLN